MIIRAHLYLAKCGVQSRRQSEEIIRAGRATINGERITASRLVDTARDVVTVDGRRIALAPHVYYAFHKPINVICSSIRQGEYPIVQDFIHVHRKMHLFTVGRLDRLTSGLLLVTNDGEFARRVLLPQYEIEKEYIVHTYDPIPVERIREFIPSAPRRHRYTIKKYRLISKKCIQLIVTEGKRHEIRNIMKYCRCGVSSLMRVRIDDIRLGALKAGEYRELSEKERERM